MKLLEITLGLPIRKVMKEEFLGRYRLLEKIDSGGMAEVFLARLESEAEISRWFAIKRLLSNLSEKPRVVQMFEHEAKLAIRMSHPNIVTVFEFGREKGSYFLTMEYIAGKTLSQIIKKLWEARQVVPQVMALHIVREVARALDYAHRLKDKRTGQSLNLVHRDVTPRNIFIGYDGMIKLSDFGIAKSDLTEEQTKVGEMKGTMAYMSPEQYSGESLNQQSDLFSLGAVLWDLLTGTRLIDPGKVKKGHLFLTNTEDVLFSKIKSAEIPEDLKAILYRSMRFSLHARYFSADEFLNDIEKALEARVAKLSFSDVAAFVQYNFENDHSDLYERLRQYSEIPFMRRNYQDERRSDLIDDGKSSGLEMTALPADQMGDSTSKVESAIQNTIRTGQRLYSSWFGQVSKKADVPLPSRPASDPPVVMEQSKFVGSDRGHRTQVTRTSSVTTVQVVTSEFKVFGRAALISFFISASLIWVFKSFPDAISSALFVIFRWL